MIFNPGGGSGNKVVIKAIASASDLPATAVANTIYVVTSTAINNILLTAGDVPETATEGDLTITIDDGTKYELGLTNFKLKYGMVSVRQYVSGSWVGKEAYHEVDGSWIMISYSLVKDGTEVAEHLVTTTTFTAVDDNMPMTAVNSELPTITRNTGYTSLTNHGGHEIGYVWIRFDVTSYSKLVIRYKTSNTNFTICGLHTNLTTTWAGPNSSTAAPWAKESTIRENTSTYETLEIDISDLTGYHYLFFAPYYFSGYGATIDVKDIWMA